MAQNDILKRYLDAGIAFTAMTQARAEAIVKDLVKAGEVQSDSAQAVVLDLVDRSRQNTEKLLAQVRNEVRSQVKNLGLATQADIDRLDRKISAIAAPAGRKAAAPRQATAKKTAAKKTAAKKAPAKRAASKKAVAKKAPAKRA